MLLGLLVVLQLESIVVWDASLCLSLDFNPFTVCFRKGMVAHHLSIMIASQTWASEEESKMQAKERCLESLRFSPLFPFSFCKSQYVVQFVLVREM